MDIIEQLAKMFINIIRAGSVVRTTYCFIKMSMDEEKVNIYKKRIKNVVVFYVLAESIWQIKNMLVSYFSTSGL